MSVEWVPALAYKELKFHHKNSMTERNVRPYVLETDECLHLVMAKKIKKIKKTVFWKLILSVVRNAIDDRYFINGRFQILL